MAEDIRNRRLTTELENLDRIDTSKISFEKTFSSLNNDMLLQIKFNLKDHPYNPRLLTDKSELSLADPDVEGDEEGHIQEEEEDEEFGEPIDE